MRTKMYKSALNALNCYASRALSTQVVSLNKRKVTILGFADGIGEDLAVLMRLNPRVSTLSLFNFGGSADYVNSIPTRAQIETYDGYDGYEEALKDSDVVIIPTGVPKKFGDMFDIHASIVKDHCEAISKYSSGALVNIICNHVNSTVPIAAKVLQNAGTYDPKKLFGVTSLDGFRANTLYSSKADIDDKGVSVPVVGGHAGITILPLFSQATPQVNLSREDIKFLTSRVRYGGTEVIANGKSSAISSRAFAGAMFANACLKGLNGVPDVVQCSYVQSEVTELPFFTSKVRLGQNGVEEIMGLGSLSDDERASLEDLIPELKQSINKGIEFV